MYVESLMVLGMIIHCDLMESLVLCYVCCFFDNFLGCVLVNADSEEHNRKQERRRRRRWF